MTFKNDTWLLIFYTLITPPSYYQMVSLKSVLIKGLNQILISKKKKSLKMSKTS